MLGIVMPASGAPATTSAKTLSISPAGSDAFPCTAAQPCQSFDRAYHVAAPGDTVLVSAGVYPVTDPPANATRITPDAAKLNGPDVIFSCRGDGDVSFAAPNFTIQAAHVTIRGGCFRFHVVNLSQPGDSVLNASYITLDGVHVESFASHGSDHATIVNSEVGPNVACHPQNAAGVGLNGGAITPAMWCDPAGPPYEAFYAGRGNLDLQMEPFVHGNSGRETTNFTLAKSRIHDIQTKDAYNLHTGGLLILQSGDSSISIRDNTFERNAAYDIEGDPSPRGVVIERNWFGAGVEPLSSGQGPDKPLDRQEVEHVFRPGGQMTLSGWTVRRNSFAHTYAPQGVQGATFENVQVSFNIFGAHRCLPYAPGISAHDNLSSPACAPVVIPYGYVLNGGRLQPDPKRAKVVAQVFSSAAHGKLPALISRAMRRNHAPRPAGGWSYKSVRKLLTDSVYLGDVYGPPGAHPALVQRGIWHKAQKALKALSLKR